MSLCHVVPELSWIDPGARPVAGEPLRPGSAHYRTFRAVQLAFARMGELGEFNASDEQSGKAKKSGERPQSLPKKFAKLGDVSAPLELELPGAFDPTSREVTKP